jgi:hypothetical protein
MKFLRSSYEVPPKFLHSFTKFVEVLAQFGELPTKFDKVQRSLLKFDKVPTQFLRSSYEVPTKIANPWCLCHAQFYKVPQTVSAVGVLAVLPSSQDLL